VQQTKSHINLLSCIQITLHNFRAQLHKLHLLFRTQFEFLFWDLLHIYTIVTFLYSLEMLRSNCLKQKYISHLCSNFSAGFQGNSLIKTQLNGLLLKEVTCSQVSKSVISLLNAFHWNKFSIVVSSKPIWGSDVARAIQVSIMCRIFQLNYDFWNRNWRKPGTLPSATLNIFRTTYQPQRPFRRSIKLLRKPMPQLAVSWL